MTSKPRLRIGMIGTGFMGKAHAQAFQRLNNFYDLAVIPELVTVADVDANLAQAAAMRYGFRRWTTDWRDIVADPTIDLVDIVTPNHAHADIALATADAGKNIYCEKPLADTPAMQSACGWQRNKPA